MYHYTDGGLRNIWLANGYEQMETPYSMAITIQDLPGLSRAICKALIRKNSKLTGAEFRYLRQVRETCEILVLMSSATIGPKSYFLYQIVSASPIITCRISVLFIL